MEPRAATPERRLEAVRALADAGVPTVVMFAPVIPGLNDHELEAVLERAAEAGRLGAGYVALRLPLEIKDLFREWLEANVPTARARVMSLVRQMRGGRDYDPQWGKRMKGEGPIAELIVATVRHRPAPLRFGSGPAAARYLPVQAARDGKSPGGPVRIGFRGADQSTASSRAWRPDEAVEKDRTIRLTSKSVKLV